MDQQALHYQVHPKQKIINIACKYKYSNTCEAANYFVHFKYCTYDCSRITRWTSRTMITTCTLKIVYVYEHRCMYFHLSLPPSLFIHMSLFSPSLPPSSSSHFSLSPTNRCSIGSSLTRRTSISFLSSASLWPYRTSSSLLTGLTLHMQIM